MPHAPVPRPRPSRRTERRTDPARATAVPATAPEVRTALEAAGWHVRARPGAHDGVLASDASGADCAVDLVRVPDDPTARAALVAHLDALAHDDEHLAAVRAVVEVGDAALAVLTDHVDGLRLDELAAARAAFTPGEAVTVLVPVAQGLAALHRTGRVHGRLDAGAVTLSPDGRAVVHPPLTPADGTPADDVRDLARLVLGLVPPPASSHPASADPPTDPAEGEALSALHAELVAALREDPRARPAAGTFAARCYDAVEPRPVTMPDPARLVAVALGGGRRRAVPASRPAPSRRAARLAHDPSSGRGARRAGAPGPRAPVRPGPWRAVLTAVGVVAGCAVLVAVLLQVSDGGPAGVPTGDATAADARTADDRPAGPAGPATGPADPTADRADPLGAARELTVRRLALLTGGSGDLGTVVAPGSPAEATEAALLAELEGVEVLDARAEVFDVREAVVPPGGTAEPGAAEPAPSEVVAVEVDHAVSAHRQRSGGEDVHVPQTSRTTVVLVLRWTGEAWRVAEVR